MKWTKGEFTVSDAVGDVQVARVHAYLTRSYWAEGISRELVARSVENSLCFALLHGGVQAGFARVVTDRATFGYLADVYVLDEYRGAGLGKWLIGCVMAHPELQGLRRIMLATRDAHGLYARHGFAAPKKPESLMEIRREGLYRAADGAGRAAGC